MISMRKFFSTFLKGTGLFSKKLSIIIAAKKKKKSKKRLIHSLPTISGIQTPSKL